MSELPDVEEHPISPLPNLAKHLIIAQKSQNEPCEITVVLTYLISLSRDHDFPASDFRSRISVHIILAYPPIGAMARLHHKAQRVLTQSRGIGNYTDIEEVITSQASDLIERNPTYFYRHRQGLPWQCHGAYRTARREERRTSRSACQQREPYAL